MNKNRRALSTFGLRNQEKGQSKELPIGAIELPDYQPRQYFDSDKLQELSSSIIQHGILEPLLVRPLPSSEKYELVAGGRRFLAAQMAGLISVPAIVRELSEPEASEIALLENLQREDLNPVEETEAVLKLLSFRLNKEVSEVTSLLYRLQNQLKNKTTDNVIGKEIQATVEEVLSRLSMTFESFMVNRLRLLNLPEDILMGLRLGKIAYTKAIAISQVKNDQQRCELFKQAIGENLSLTDIKKRIRQIQAKEEKEEITPQLRTKKLLKLVNQRKTWEKIKNKRKLKRLEKLLQELEELLQNNS